MLGGYGLGLRALPCELRAYLLRLRLQPVLCLACSELRARRASRRATQSFVLAGHGCVTASAVPRLWYGQAICLALWRSSRLSTASCGGRLRLAAVVTRLRAV